MRVRDVVLVVLGFATAALYVPGFVDAGGVPRWAVLAAGVPIALIVLEHQDVPRWAFAWLPAAALTVAWAPDSLHALDELAHLAILAAAFYLGACARDLRPLWAGIAAGVAVSSVAAIAQLAGWQGVAQVAVPAGLFVNPNMLGEGAMVAAIAALAAGWWTLGAIALVAAGLAGSKAVAGALVVVLVMYTLRRDHVALPVVLSLALIAAAAALMAFGSASIEARIQIWSAAWSNLAPFGHGLGSFAVDFPMALRVHNEPLELVYELGVLSVPCFAVFIYALGAPADDRTELERLLLVAIAAVALVSFPLHMPVTAFAAAAAAGRLCGARHRVRDRHDALAITPRFCP